MNEKGQFSVRGLVRLLNIKFGNTVVISLLIRLCMTVRVECGRLFQSALAVQFWNGMQFS